MMKKSIFLGLIVFGFYACEEVVNVNLKESKERLVINASINWFRNYPSNQMESGQEQTIYLTKTVGYYDQVEPANNALVYIRDENTSEVFEFNEDNLSGAYRCNNFKPILNHFYTLLINYNNEDYIATEQLINTPIIDSIIQQRGGFFDEEEIVVKVYYTDDEDQDNYYYFNYTTSISKINELSITSDRFTNGNTTFEQISYNGSDDEKIEIGDTFYIQFYETNKAYNLYLDILLDQVYSQGLFAPVPAEVKGNVKNISNEDNYPYGYFRINIGNKAEVTITEDELIEE